MKLSFLLILSSSSLQLQYLRMKNTSWWYFVHILFTLLSFPSFFHLLSYVHAQENKLKSDSWLQGISKMQKDSHFTSKRQIVLCLKQCDKQQNWDSRSMSSTSEIYDFKSGRKLQKENWRKYFFLFPCHSNANQVSNKCELNHIANTCLVP